MGQVAAFGRSRSLTATENAFGLALLFPPGAGNLGAKAKKRADCSSSWPHHGALGVRKRPENADLPYRNMPLGCPFRIGSSRVVHYGNAVCHALPERPRS